MNVFIFAISNHVKRSKSLVFKKHLTCFPWLVNAIPRFLFLFCCVFPFVFALFHCGSQRRNVKVFLNWNLSRVCCLRSAFNPSVSTRCHLQHITYWRAVHFKWTWTQSNFISIKRDIITLLHLNIYNIN